MTTDANTEIIKLSELSNKDPKAAMIKMLLSAITNMLETKQSLSKETEEEPNGYQRGKGQKLK